jgi:hypothetical protein
MKKSPAEECDASRELLSALPRTLSLSMTQHL